MQKMTLDVSGKVTTSFPEIGILKFGGLCIRCLGVNCKDFSLDFCYRRKSDPLAALTRQVQS